MPAGGAAKPGLTEISGSVVQLYCQRPTFSAGVMAVKGRSVKFSVKGYVPAGEPLTLRGSWETHPKYGRQFVATDVVYTLPADMDGLGQWLQWYGDFVGPVKSRKLLDEFGMDLMRLCVEDPGQVAACGGVPIESVHRLAERWQAHAGRVAAATQLAAWGLTQRETEAVLAKFGGSAVQLVRDDPFAAFGRVDGFGWKTTDALAARVGVTGTDPRRLRGAVAAVVREQYAEGSTAVPVTTACELAAERIGADPEAANKVMATVGRAVEAGQLRRAGSGALSWLATAWGWECEAAVWRVLGTARDPNPCTGAAAGVDFKLLNLAHQYAKLSAGGKTYELDGGQVHAVYAAAKYRISVVTGGAGVGKTLVARAVTKLFLDADVPVALCAPTGKAARRLEEVIGREATTIHRLLEFSGQDGGFKRNSKRPLFYEEDSRHRPGVVVVDEASMVDGELAYHLLTALGPKTALVLIGDPNQLPPVGPGAVLRDVLAHDLAPVTRLEKCHRQAGTLKKNCHAVLGGVVEPWASDESPSPWVVSRQCGTHERVVQVVRDLYARHLPDWGFDPVRDAQFMTAKHDGRLGTRRLNVILQRLHQKALGNDLGEPADDEHERRPVLYRGDKVIHTKNNYELEVMNGTLGVVRETHPSLVVEYDGRAVVYPKKDEGEVSLGYCLTPHKMQGSEVPCAVVVVPKLHAFMQHRHWLYTAVTRAKVAAVVVGDEDGVRRAAERVDNDRRVTLLQVFAAHPEARP